MHLPPTIRDEIDEIVRITREVSEAAGEGRASALEALLEQRAEALSGLEHGVRQFRKHCDAVAETALAQALAAIDREAAVAGEQLCSLQRRARLALESLRQDQTAVRGYSASLEPASALDRSG